LNRLGVFTRRQLLAADRSRVKAALQTAQPISEARFDEILAQAAQLDGAQPDVRGARAVAESDLYSGRSTHTFSVEITVEAESIVGMAIRHVVSGTPSVWDSFASDHLEEFISSALGLEPVCSTPAPAADGDEPRAQRDRHEETISESDATCSLSSFGVVEAPEDVTVPPGARDLEIVLRHPSIGSPVDWGAAAWIDVQIFARDRNQPGAVTKIGSAKRVALDDFDQGIAVSCQAPPRGTYVIEVLMEVFAHSLVATAPRAFMPDVVVTVASETVTKHPALTRTQRLRRRAAALERSRLVS
jgi:hypothetical protein